MSNDKPTPSQAALQEYEPYRDAFLPGCSGHRVEKVELQSGERATDVRCSCGASVRIDDDTMEEMRRDLEGGNPKAITIPFIVGPLHFGESPREQRRRIREAFEMPRQEVEEGGVASAMRGSLPATEPVHESDLRRMAEALDRRNPRLPMRPGDTVRITELDGSSFEGTVGEDGSTIHGEAVEPEPDECRLPWCERPTEAEGLCDVHINAEIAARRWEGNQPSAADGAAEVGPRLTVCCQGEEEVP